jgi:hypothetical protein
MSAARLLTPYRRGRRETLKGYCGGREAMPEEVDQCSRPTTADALTLQRPLLDDALRIVAKGEKAGFS